MHGVSEKLVHEVISIYSHFSAMRKALSQVMSSSLPDCFSDQTFHFAVPGVVMGHSKCNPDTET